MKQIGLYARVSGDKQEREETIASQLEKMKALAAEKGLTVLDRHIYLDDGYSGSELARPGLDRLRDDVRDGLLDVVLVYCPDRLARRYAYQVVIVEELQRGGCDVYFVNRPIADTPEDQMLLGMQGVIAEYERAKIMERTRRGRLHKARMGMLVVGSAPYGYHYIPRQGAERGRIEVAPEEATVVVMIFRFVAEEGLPVEAVARRLTAMNVPTRHTGSMWRPSTVHQIVRNPAYVGEFCCNRYVAVEPQRPRATVVYRRSRKSSIRQRPREEWIRVSGPAIIDRDLFEAAQQRLLSNQRLALRRADPRRQRLLRCLVRCGRCGYSMQVFNRERGERLYSYYACVAHAHPWRYKDGARCPTPSITAEQLDAFVWADLSSMLQDPERIARCAGLGSSVPEQGPLRDEAKRLAGEIDACDRQLQRLLDAYQREVIEIDDMERRRKAVVERRSLLGDMLKRVEMTLRDAELRRVVRERLPDLTKQVKDRLQAAEVEIRQQLVRLLIDRVVVMPNRDVEISYVLPLSGNSGLHPKALPLKCASAAMGTDACYQPCFGSTMRA
jgi:site-specific DNA recombinase